MIPSLRKYATNFSLLLASLVLSFLILELYLRFRPTQRVYIETRNIIQQYIGAPLPSVGYANRPGALFRFRNMEFDTTVKINSKGLRDQDYTYERSASDRILVLGDSFSFGWGVEENQTVTEILENNFFKNTEVINMSVSGYSTLHEIRLLQLEGAKYNPDLIIIFWYGNDIDNRIAAPYFRNGIMYLNYENHELTEDELILKRIKKLSYSFCFFATLRKQFVEFYTRNAIHVRYPVNGNDEQWKYEAELLKNFKEESDKLGAKLLVVRIPFRGDYRPQERLKIILDELRVSYLDLANEFVKLTPIELRKLYYQFDEHWTRNGHRIAARCVADFIQQNHLLPTL